MKKDKLAKRYALFILGVVFNGLGVTFVTKGGLGTSPIAAIPYSLSMIIPSLTMGNWMIIYNWLLILVQWILLKKNANKIELLIQFAITVVFGYVTDFFLWLCSPLVPANYVMRIVFLLVGCIIIAFGAFLEVTADVSMLPADGFVTAISKTVHKEYGKIRVISDITMSVAACILCLVFLHKLAGVREGTVIAAIITGNIVRLFSRIFSGFAKKFNQ